MAKETLKTTEALKQTASADAEYGHVLVRTTSDLRRALGKSALVADDGTPVDSVPALFDMSGFTCIMGNTFTDVIGDFVTQFAGPMIATHGTRQRVLACRPMIQRATLSTPTKLEIADSVFSAAKGSVRKPEWVLVMDELTSRYFKRTSSASTSSSTTPVKSGDTEPKASVELTVPETQASIAIERVSAWLSTSAGRDAVRSRSSDLREPNAYRRSTDGWEWNARFLSHVLFPLVKNRGLSASQRKDIDNAHEWTTKLVDNVDKKREDASRARAHSRDADSDDAASIMPPLPVVFGTPYVEEKGFLEKFAPTASIVLAHVRTSGFPRILHGQEDDSDEEKVSKALAEEKKEEVEDVETEQEDDAESVESLEESVVQMGIAQPPAAAKEAEKGEKAAKRKPAAKGPAKNPAMEQMFIRYFTSFPHLQMDCRSVATLSKDGHGFKAYMFNTEQLFALCNSIKAEHALCMYDSSREAAHKKWLFESATPALYSPPSASKDSPPLFHPRPQRTHARQALFELAQELAAMYVRMRETDVRLKKFDEGYTKRKGKTAHGVWPHSTILSVPWFEHSVRIDFSAFPENTRRSVESGAYYTAFREGKTAKWAEFVRAAKNRLWDLIQSGSCVPLGSLASSDPELDFLMTVHDSQSIWNVPLQSHAAVFKLAAWSGSLPITIESLVDRLNTAVNTAAFWGYKLSGQATFQFDPVEWAKTRKTSPINLCYPLTKGTEPRSGQDALAALGVIGPELVAKRLKDMLASSVALLGAVYKFLLYVGTMAHKVLIAERVGELREGSTREYFEALHYGLTTAVMALDIAKAMGVQSNPSHAVYGAGQFGPAETRPLKKTPERSATFVDTVDPIRIFQEIAHAEGRPHVRTQSWSRMMIEQRFPDPADDRSGNESIAMTTQFMEDLLNTAAYHMTSDGWRINDTQEKKGAAMKTAENRLERRRMPLHICANLSALVACVRGCVAEIMRPRFVRRVSSSRPLDIRGDKYTEFVEHVWAERTDLALSMTRDTALRSHILAATKAWWPMGILMCTMPSGNMSFINEFTCTRGVINQCIRRCVVAHTDASPRR